MSRLESLELYRVRLPLRRPHRWPSLRGTIGSYVLVRLTSTDGVTGWGEATALGSWGGDYGRHDGETPEGVWEVLGGLVAPAVIGVEFADRHTLLDRVDGLIRGHPYAKTAFEEALLDLVARTAGTPVYELLGGRRRDRIELTHSIGLMPQDEAIEEAAKVADEGVRTIKLKVGEDADRDVALVHALYAALGDRVALALDANQAWRTALGAERVLRRLVDVPLRYVEQPVEGLRQLELLAERVPYPLMADESMWSARDMADLALGGRVGLASIYTAKAGGLHRALAADAVAQAFSIGTNVNGSGETGIGNLANLHLAAAMTSLSEGCTIPLSGRADERGGAVAGVIYSDDLLTESMVFRDGCVLVPDGPGWGMEVDPDQLAAYTETHERFA